MAAVALSLVSAALFGAMAVALAFSFRRSHDAEAGALTTGLVALTVTGVFALVSGSWGGDLWPFLVTGLIAPGGSQLRTSVPFGRSAPRAAVVVGRRRSSP
jgi:hypothetical protein